MKSNLRRKSFLIILITVFLTGAKTATAGPAEPTETLVNNYCKNFIDLSLQNVAFAGVVAPSLWWAKEQFDPFGGRLIDNWLEDKESKQIDLIVNWQLWTLLDYLDRYRLVNQLGSVARKYDYKLRIINQQKQCLATYQYQEQDNPPKWEINLDSLGQDSFQVEPETDN
ncbi:hypothetical protein Xen7305DRAFT_00030690 [Xenococcus sp. PCC 7305]|uniref:hypothetical protein n=1 Tax=Xenococcus sp. PCC 7305 TaxID=102125 RepID=UPI0002ACC934|nr:hypothetical protein [Xenococcus sp. PCC 7305]ELS03347.1 hypothetical protein Xen7305DRAFT_00030690 [Xenococcus sp. PCC 7305]